MYVIGKKENEFIGNVLRDTMMDEYHNLYSKIHHLEYNCLLQNAEIYINYKDAEKELQEIKEHGKNISIRNNDLFGSIIDKKNNFDKEEYFKQLKIFELKPILVEDFEKYCEWEINSVFPEQINNPHVSERENISTTKYCPCCGKKIRIVKH